MKCHKGHETDQALWNCPVCTDPDVEAMFWSRKVVNAQAEDECLWFLNPTAPEAYLQRALRVLHAAIEGDEAMVRKYLREMEEDAR